MKFPNFSPHGWGVFGAAAALLAATALAPAFAGPTTVTLSGSVNNITTTSGSTPMFSAGDMLSGMFSANVGQFGHFDLSDLQSFSVSLGNYTFGLPDLTSLYGTLLTNGSGDVTDFGLVFSANTASAGTVLFGFNGLGQPFSATGTTAIANGSFNLTVSTAASAVPEPPMWALFLPGIVVIGVFAIRRRRKGGAACA